MTKTICFLSCFLLSLFAYSQSAKDSLIIGDTTQVHLLQLKSGDKLLGNLMEMKEAQLVFKFHGNILKFDSVNVSQIYFLKQAKKKFKKKKIPFLPPKIIRGEEQLLFTETAFSQPANTLQYKTVLLFTHQIDYGLTDNITIGTGLLLSVGGFNAKVKFTKKFSDFKRIGLSLHHLSFNYYFYEPNENILFPQISITYGDRKKFSNLSLGAWLPLSSEVKAIFISYGGEFELKNNWRFFTNNYLAATKNAIILLPLAGIKKNKRRNRFEFAVGIFSNFPVIRRAYNYRFSTFIPYVGYARQFGKR